MVIPLHLHRFLDLARKILKNVGLESWEDFRGGRTVTQSTDEICDRFANSNDCPSR